VTPFVVPLTAVGRDDLALAGGKGANLGELIAAGLPVPDGFVVTTAAYAELIDRCGIAERIPRLLDAGDGAGIRAEFAAAEIPAAMAEAITAAYRELGRGPVAVRSSATAEDLPGAAFAGQQDTYLNVEGDDALLDAVRRCWGSLWTDRAIAYRRRLGIGPEQVRIAVVVQRMVNPDAAGVMFTADPVSGDRDRIVVDTSPGLGEAVVSGRVTPDHYELDRRGTVLAWTPGRAEVVVRAAAGGGLAEEAGQATGERLLGDAALAGLARLGVAVQDRFGRPMDIEWALAGGRVWLVQARPMTALPPPPVRLNAIQRRLGEMLLDYLPTRPYPMDMSTWIPYGPAGMMAEVARSLGVRGLFEGALEEQDGVVYRILPRPPRLTPKALAAPFLLLHRAGRFDPARWTEDPRFTGFLREVERLRGLDPAAMPWPELIRLPRRALDAVRPITELRRDYLPRGALMVLRLVAALLPLGAAAMWADLLAGARTRTEDGNRALERLAALVREDPRLKAAVDALDLDRVKGFTGFWAEFTAFLAEYGHRETGSPVLASSPTWEETPEVVLGMLKVLAASPPSPPPAAPARPNGGCAPTPGCAPRGGGPGWPGGSPRRAPRGRSARTPTSTSRCRCRCCAVPCSRSAPGCATPACSRPPRTCSTCGWRRWRPRATRPPCRGRGGRSWPPRRGRGRPGGRSWRACGSSTPARSTRTAATSGTHWSAARPGAAARSPARCGSSATRRSSAASPRARCSSARTPTRPGRRCSSAPPRSWSTPAGSGRTPRSSPASTACPPCWARPPAPPS